MGNVLIIQPLQGTANKRFYTWVEDQLPQPLVWISPMLGLFIIFANIFNDTFHMAKALSTAGCKVNHSFNTRGLISTVITDTSSMSLVRLKLYSKIATIIFTSVYCLYPFVIPRRVKVSFKALNKASWSSGWSIRIWFNSLFGLLALKTKN